MLCQPTRSVPYCIVEHEMNGDNEKKNVTSVALSEPFHQ